MPSDHIPTVFVALVLAPNQYDLYEEVQAEALDVLEGRPVALRSNISGGEGVILMDCDCVRIALRWSETTHGDVLTLAIGSRPDLAVPCSEVRPAADMLRQLVSRAEALFEVQSSVWQIAMLPLVAGSLNIHIEQLNLSGAGAEPRGFGSFVTFQPDQPPARLVADPLDPARRMTSAGDFLSSLRDAMDGANTEPSWAMQASTLALSTAFVLVTPPVGIAMFTYAALRQGKDMGLLPDEIDLGQTAQGHALHA